jgi:hypothetical protein
MAGYLSETLSDAERRAQTLADGCIDVDTAVLAIGNLPSGPPFPAPQSDRFIADPWAPWTLSGMAALRVPGKT